MNKQQSQLVILFSQNLRRIREAKGYSQEELASLAGLDRTYISGCERGIRNPSLASVERIAKALKVSPKELLDE